MQLSCKLKKMTHTEIKIGNIVFENTKTYSKTDKIRDKYYFKATVFGLVISVTNNKWCNDKVSFDCDGLGISSNFTNLQITPEVACKAALKNVLAKLQKIEIELINNLK